MTKSFMKLQLPIVNGASCNSTFKKDAESEIEPKTPPVRIQQWIKMILNQDVISFIELLPGFARLVEVD